LDIAFAHDGLRFDGTTKIKADLLVDTERYTIRVFQKFSEKTKNLRDQYAYTDWDFLNM